MTVAADPAVGLAIVDDGHDDAVVLEPVGPRAPVPALTPVTSPPGPPSAEARLRALLDEVAALVAHDGVVVAEGRVGAVDVVAFATDPSVQGGALGAASCSAVAAAHDRAVERDVPVVGLWHSGGARLREGVPALHGVAAVFAAQTRASGRVPQVAVVLGPAAGGAAYGPALADVVVQAPLGRVFVTGPDVVRSVTGQACDAERLGGTTTHARSGVAHVRALDEDDALDRARLLVDLLARRRDVPAPPPPGHPGEKVPTDPRQSYDVRDVARALLDEGTFLELQAGWAPNVVVGLGRLGGRTVGVVANQPAHLAGCLDAASGDKSGRFVQWCDTAGVPLVLLADVPGYLPGVSQEDEGVLRRGAKLLHAYAASTVPRLTVVLRKAYGGAFIAMGSKGLGADVVLAWPGASVDVMGATSAVGVLHRRELAAAPASERAALVERLAAEHVATTGGLDRALECGAVDAVVEPERTREVLLEALARLGERRGLRRNSPL